MNDAVYQIACFMILREPEIWRWNDRAITPTRSSSAATLRSSAPSAGPSVALALHLFAQERRDLLPQVFIHAAGRLTDEESTFVSAIERS